MYNRLFSIIILFLISSFSFGDDYKRTADIALEYRIRNVGGSCVHCSTTVHLRWLGLYGVAEGWRSSYYGGESPGPHRRKMEEMGLRYVMTSDGDERVLEYAISSRRGAGVTWGGAHCVNLIGRVQHNGQLYAIILDNNRPGQYKTQPWDSFLREWRKCGGWGFVVLDGKVPPPIPKINFTSML